MYPLVCDVRLRYCAIKQKSVIAGTQRIAILLSLWAAGGSLGVAPAWRSAAVKHAKMTRLTPLISVPFHIVICRYCFCCGWYPGYGGMFSHILSKTQRRLCYFKKASIHSIRYFCIPSRILCRISPRTRRGGVMISRVHKALGIGFAPAAFMLGGY